MIDSSVIYNTHPFFQRYLIDLQKTVDEIVFKTVEHQLHI